MTIKFNKEWLEDIGFRGAQCDAIEAREMARQLLAVREVMLPSFDGYVPHIAKELQAAFRIACADAGIRINGED